MYAFLGHRLYTIGTLNRKTVVAKPKHQTRTDTAQDRTNGTLANDTQQDGSAQFDLVAAILENPRPFIADLHEEISELVDALIDARLNPNVEAGATRRDIALDLYDEELISKQNAITKARLESSEFYDALIARRRARSRS